jgi:hypothetical protein
MKTTCRLFYSGYLNIRCEGPSVSSLSTATMRSFVSVDFAVLRALRRTAKLSNGIRVTRGRLVLAVNPPRLVEANRVDTCKQLTRPECCDNDLEGFFFSGSDIARSNVHLYTSPYCYDD